MKITIKLDSTQVKEILGFLKSISSEPEFEDLRNVTKKDIPKEIPWMIDNFIDIMKTIRRRTNDKL